MHFLTLKSFFATVIIGLGLAVAPASADVFSVTDSFNGSVSAYSESTPGGSHNVNAGLNGVTVGNLQGGGSLLGGFFETKGGVKASAKAEIASGGALLGTIGTLKTGGTAKLTTVSVNADVAGDGAAVGAHRSVSFKSATAGEMSLGAGKPAAAGIAQISGTAKAKDANHASVAMAIAGTVTIGKGN